MIITTAMYIGYLYFVRPYEEDKQNKLSLLNEFFVLIIAFCLIGFCSDNLSSEGQESLGWFLIVWINLIAAFNMGIAVYQTIKETYKLLRDKCRAKAKVASDQEIIDGETEQKCNPPNGHSKDLTVIDIDDDVGLKKDNVD